MNIHVQRAVPPETFTLRDMVRPQAWRSVLRAAPPRRRGAAFAALLLVCTVLAFRNAFWLVTPWNVMTQSLTHQWMFVWLGRAAAGPPAEPALGQYVAFRVRLADRPQPLKVIKRVLGRAGDRVTRTVSEAPDGLFDYYVNGVFAGTVRKGVMTGPLRLSDGPTGVIPPGHLYVAGTSPDSVDSRFAEIGWVPLSDVLGIAYPLD